MSTSNIQNTLKLIYHTPTLNHMLLPQHGTTQMTNLEEISSQAQAILQAVPMITWLTTGTQLSPIILQGAPILGGIALFGIMSHHAATTKVCERIKTETVLHLKKFKLIWTIIKVVGKLIFEAGAYVLIEKAVDEGINGSRRKQEGIDENLPEEKKTEKEKPTEEKKPDETEKKPDPFPESDWI